MFSGIDTDRRGIRLDAYIEARPDDDPQVTLYDIEPQNRYNSTGELLRRDRYYTSLIDVQQLSSGQISYDLPDIVTILHDERAEGFNDATIAHIRSLRSLGVSDDRISADLISNFNVPSDQVEEMLAMASFEGAPLSMA